MRKLRASHCIRPKPSTQRNSHGTHIGSQLFEENRTARLQQPPVQPHPYKTEIADPAQAQAESSRLYDLLQTSVDHSLQQVGWLPYGKPSNGHTNGNGTGQPDKWNCSDKQRELIERIVDENRLDKTQVEQLSQDRFGKDVRHLNKLEASGLIDELFEKHGGNNGNNRRRFSNRPAIAR
jgi:hypothetical protein